MTTPTASGETETDNKLVQANNYWCNFCEFKSDDLETYLGHSCIDELAARGITPTPTGHTECR